MNRRFFSLSLVCLAALSSACSSVAPDAGFEAVLIRKPILFGHGGVVADPVKTGRSYVALTTKAIMVDMRPLQAKIHFEDFMSSDGVPLDFDAVIRVRITDSVRMIEKFGPEWYAGNVEAELVNRVRQEIRKHGMNETAINSTAVDEIDQKVTGSMESYIKDTGIPIQMIAFTVGKANPPDSIKHQRVETAAQEQRVNTERQRTLAENARLSAEQSRANADNAYREAMKLSPDQFLQLESIKMQQAACAAGHCTFIIGHGVTPVLPVNSRLEK